MRKHDFGASMCHVAVSQWFGVLIQLHLCEVSLLATCPHPTNPPLPSLFLKAMHPSGSAVANFIGWECMPEQALGGIPLGFGIVVENRPSCLCMSVIYCV